MFPFAGAVECDVSISITSNKERFDSGDKIEFYNKLDGTPSSSNYVIEYWAEDLEGSIIKKKTNTTNQNKKTFTPKNIEAGVVLKARIADLECNDDNLEDNFAEKKILFKGVRENTENHSVKTVSISFSVDKNRQKLKNFALNTNRTQTKPKETISDNKLKKTAPYFILILTTLLSIVLIWKR